MSDDEYPKIHGYISFFRNRKDKKGGGIAILVKSEYEGSVTMVERGEESNERGDDEKK